MNLKRLIILVFLVITIPAIGQADEACMYGAAYDYLNDSIIEVNYPNAKILRSTCKKYVKGVKLKFDDELQVASRFIRNDWGFPFCDLLKSKYNVLVSCVYAIGSGDFKLTEHIQDSLSVFWKDYEMKSQSEIEDALGVWCQNVKTDILYSFQIFTKTPWQLK